MFIISVSTAQEGHLNCLVWLAKHSGTAHCEMSVDGTTAVHAAALEGHLECMAFLLSSAGCSALARDRAANTPLHYGTKTEFMLIIFMVLFKLSGTNHIIPEINMF